MFLIMFAQKGKGKLANKACISSSGPYSQSLSWFPGLQEEYFYSSLDRILVHNRATSLSIKFTSTNLYTLRYSEAL